MLGVNNSKPHFGCQPTPPPQISPLPADIFYRLLPQTSQRQRRFTLVPSAVAPVANRLTSFEFFLSAFFPMPALVQRLPDFLRHNLEYCQRTNFFPGPNHQTNLVSAANFSLVYFAAVWPTGEPAPFLSFPFPATRPTYGQRTLFSRQSHNQNQLALPIFELRPTYLAGEKSEKPDFMICAGKP